ncbi:UDP-N-acetylmuramoyl-L-alanine--D-glutamate ligase [Candidatus Dependentiae bacterium]|nr:UDP-N-acetylmuramoyl-L-alanine--D-glutamate ligase [Candidatus Dependentiae bacterium]
MLKKIGILGFGIVGKSYLKFFLKLHANLEIGIWDKRQLEDFELKLIKDLNVKIFNPNQRKIQDFLNQYDYIAISPGFSFENFQIYKKKIICELDLFSKSFTGKSIAITGTLGKTTITNLLNLALKKIFKISVCYGGNIGLPMLNIILQQQQIDYSILELSSFQLELNKNFAPDIAIWTNFYSNHIDRHKNIKSYFWAKSKIFKFQNKNQYLIVSASFLKEKLFLQQLNSIKSQIYFVEDVPEKELKEQFIKLKKKYSNIVFIDKHRFNLNFSILPDITFEQNWLFVLTVLKILKLDFNVLRRYLETCFNNYFQEHRLEYFATINGIDFYNDSKATVVQATLNAMRKLEKKNKPIILILGGISKGVDRSFLLKELNNFKRLKKIFCLSKKNKEFVGVKTYPSFKELFGDIMQIAKPGDQVLFSPSGASFDFFENYKHRGEIFKKFVLNSYKKG